MGGDRITVKGLKVVSIDADANILYVSGAVPGRRGTLLEISGTNNTATIVPVPIDLLTALTGRDVSLTGKDSSE